MQEYSIVEVADRGRCFKTAKTYRPGDKIFSEKAYDAVLYDDSAASWCHYTFEKAAQLYRCAGCSFARYSSRNAQKAAWANGHKEECAALKACAPRRPPATLRLAARVLWKHHRTSHKKDGLPDCIETLQHHWDSLSDSRKQTFAQMAVLTREYMAGAGSTDHVEPRLIAHLLARFSCNNHTICDEALNVVGVGLFPVGAMLNHSCTPNAMQSFQGRRIIFRAIQPIAAGQEATISYVELAATRAERRGLLLANYCFDIDAGRDAGAQLVAEKMLPGYNPQAQLKMYSTPPHLMDQHDADLTRLSPRIGANISQDDRVKGIAPQEWELEYEVPGSMNFGGQPGTVEQGFGPVIECWVSAGAGTQDEAQLLQEAGALAENLCEAVANHQVAEDRITAGNHPAAIAAAARGLEHLASCLPHSRSHILRLRLLSIMLRAQVLCGCCWPEAFAVAQQLTPLYEQLYPQVWPLMGLHQACIAKLASLLGHDDKAVQANQAAVDILKYTHPDSHLLQQQLELRHALLDLKSSEPDLVEEA